MHELLVVMFQYNVDTFNLQGSSIFLSTISPKRQERLNRKVKRTNQRGIKNQRLKSYLLRMSVLTVQQVSFTCVFYLFIIIIIYLFFFWPGPK